MGDCIHAKQNGEHLEAALARRHEHWRPHTPKLRQDAGFSLRAANSTHSTAFTRMTPPADCHSSSELQNMDQPVTFTLRESVFRDGCGKHASAPRSGSLASSDNGRSWALFLSCNPNVVRPCFSCLVRLTSPRSRSTWVLVHTWTQCLGHGRSVV